jgi:hypothetical protein
MIPIRQQGESGFFYLDTLMALWWSLPNDAQMVLPQNQSMCL